MDGSDARRPLRRGDQLPRPVRTPLDGALPGHARDAVPARDRNAGALPRGPRGQGSQYSGFNLLVGDGRRLLYFGSREARCEWSSRACTRSRTISSTSRGQGLEGAPRDEAAAGDGDEPLFAMLSTPPPRPTPSFPTPRGHRARAHALAGAHHGRRVRHADIHRAARGADAARFEERTRDATGAVTATAVFEFEFAR